MANPFEEATKSNATGYAFNRGGSHKWKYSGRAVLTPEVFKVHTVEERREQFLKDNGGLFPGMSGRADDYVLVVIGDYSNVFGWPLMFFPKDEPMLLSEG